MTISIDLFEGDNMGNFTNFLIISEISILSPKVNMDGTRSTIRKRAKRRPDIIVETTFLNKITVRRLGGWRGGYVRFVA